MIKPIIQFRAVVPGSAYPKDFTPESEFEVDSIEAKAAFDLGCLSDGDRAAVSEALGLDEDQTVAAADKAAADKAVAKKAQGTAPENKAGGAKD